MCWRKRSSPFFVLDNTKLKLRQGMNSSTPFVSQTHLLNVFRDVVYQYRKCSQSADIFVGLLCSLLTGCVYVQDETLISEAAG